MSMQKHEKKGELQGVAELTPMNAQDVRSDCEIKQAEAVAFVRRVAVATTTSHSGLERRREPRIATNDAASMHVLNPLLDGRVAVRVLDVSRNGLKLCTFTHLQRGTLVQIYLRNIVAMGEVRHCAKIGDEFHAGVQLDDVLAHHSDDEPWNRAVANQQTPG
jgi:hypothetical protein